MRTFICLLLLTPAQDSTPSLHERLTRPLGKRVGFTGELRRETWFDLLLDEGQRCGVDVYTQGVGPLLR